MSLREWLDETAPTPSSPRTTPTLEDAPVRPIPPIGSPAYRRASLARKFWIATSVRVPGAMALQRELQTRMRVLGCDPWAAAELLMRIEAIARETRP